MKQYVKKMEEHGLFLKIFIVMVISIITVSILITFSTIKMSEKLFIETFSITNYKVLNQITSNFESFSYSITKVTNNVRQSNTVKDFLEEEHTNSLYSFITYYRMIEQMDHIHSEALDFNISMLILGKNKRTYKTNFSHWPTDIDALVHHTLIEKTYEEPKKLHYQLVGDSNDPVFAEPLIVASKALLNEKSENDIYGSLFVAIRERDFRQFYTHSTSEGNDVLIIDQEGTIVSSNLQHLLGQQSKELLTYANDIQENEYDYINAHVMGKKHIVLAEYLVPFDMYIVNILDTELFMKNLINKKAIFLIGFVIVMAALFSVYFISRKLTKSLRLLVNEISNIAQNDFKQYLTVTGSYETRQLSEAFNYMLDELHDYVDQLMITQRKQRNAELEALQQQINPHFLYNTLASVKIMVQRGNKEMAAEMINALISLLQNVIGNINETVTVEQEIDNIKNYVFINQIRYGEKIKVDYFISPDCLSYKIPKLMIQPFIENAFFHAFNQKASGNIRILIAARDNELLCEVIDNGDGMALDDQQLPKNSRKIKHFSGIGIKNVDERIRLLYGDEFGVKIFSEIGKGTKVEIRLPLIQK